ncbi:MAG: hypothetical protein MO852_16865 [Candidatus Devosia euplotis]|nr:hypothetical protein [Candidatus Devosia euplotis]
MRAEVLLLLVVGCGGPRVEEAVVDLMAFEVVSGQSDDPFRAFDDGGCANPSTGFELFGGEPSFGIDAVDCAYVTVAQPTLTSIAEGDPLRFRLWHFELTAPGASSATVALALDGRVVHELYLPIPGPSGLDVPRFSAPFEVAAGAPLHFHVRNHGSNSYSLLEITVGGE